MDVLRTLRNLAGARERRSATAIVAILFCAGCASLPVPPPGSSEERAEIEQGTEVDRQIQAQFGFYDDAALNDYVATVGGRVAAVSEWTSLPWTFRVLDTPVVNAFAVPGGFLYVTRGLLAYVNSEAELAGVLGHEVAHVTSRHSAESQQRATLVGLGLILGGAVVPEFSRYGLQTGLAQSAAGLFLLRYSRAQETESDERGIGYAIAAGYDPRGIGEFFSTLQSLQTDSGGPAVPGWASTHPPVDDRIERTAAIAATAIAARPGGGEGLIIDAAPYVQRLDELVFGDNPRQGFTEGAHFMHPDLRFELDFPAEWSIANTPQAVQAVSPDNDAAVQLRIARPAAGQSTEGYVRAFLDEIEARVLRLDSTRINGMQAWAARFEVPTETPDYRVQGVWIEYGGAVYEILGLTAPAKFSGYSGAFDASLRSFRELTDRRALGVQPARLGVVRVSRASSLTDFLSGRSLSVPAATVARLNARDLSSSLDRGSFVKIVTGGPTTAPEGAPLSPSPSPRRTTPVKPAG